MLDLFALVATAFGMTTELPQREPAPIHLVAEANGGGIQLQVVGLSEAPYDAQFRLEVTSDIDAGGNRTTQRGVARLEPGSQVTLVSVRMGNVTQGRWEARLTVEPAQGAPYEEVRNSL